MVKVELAPERPSAPRRIARQTAETSLRWYTRTVRRRLEREHSCQGPVGAPVAVADTVGSGTCPPQWLLAEHTTGPPTYVAGVRPCRTVLGSCCRKGLYSARIPEGFVACCGSRVAARPRLECPESAR